jgi:hypothetical protein
MAAPWPLKYTRWMKSGLGNCRRSVVAELPGGLRLSHRHVVSIVPNRRGDRSMKHTKHMLVAAAAVGALLLAKPAPAQASGEGRPMASPFQQVAHRTYPRATYYYYAPPPRGYYYGPGYRGWYGPDPYYRYHGYRVYRPPYRYGWGPPPGVYIQGRNFGFGIRF